MNPGRFRVFPALVLCVGLPASASDKKMTEDDRIEILRGLTAEYATVKSYLPKSKKPLPFDSNGTYDKKKWEEMGMELGPAARVGDLVQITNVGIENDRILLEINHGQKKGGHWYDHVEIGMGNNTSPINRNGDVNAPGGTAIALMFDKRMPVVRSADIKKMLAPILDFDKRTATENYVEKLPEPVQKAIKDNKAIEGMDREQVLLALGKPRHKERGLKEGEEIEDWIFGQPPGKITFVTFSGSKVVKVKEAYADIGGTTAKPFATAISWFSASQISSREIPICQKAKIRRKKSRSPKKRSSGIAASRACALPGRSAASA